LPWQYELFLFLGGQFDPESSGQFEPESIGQFPPESNGQFYRILQSVKLFLNSHLDSQFLTIELPQKHSKQADELGIIERKIQIRLVKILLDSG
jgi:hypothetical protein